MARQLISINTVHDYGEVAFYIAPPLLADPGLSITTEVQNTIWQSIHRELAKIGNFSGKKLYSEGYIEPIEQKWDKPLPYDTIFDLTNAVEEASELKGRQTMLGETLFVAGAIRMPTENPTLFREAGRVMTKFFKEFRTETYSPARVRLWSAMRINDQERDKYMGENINKTLLDDETGLLVVGAAHSIFPYLEKDIEVKFISPEVERLWKLKQEGKNPYTKEGLNYIQGVERV